MIIRKIKDIIGTVLAILAVVFLLGLVFIPLQNFVNYAGLLFKVVLIFLPIYLTAEIYYFMKDIPKRKTAHRKEKTKKQKITAVIEWTFIAILVILLLLARNGAILTQECPKAIQGNPDAELSIKYFFNPFCPSCWKQEAIVQEILDEYRESVRLERYDHRYCQKEGQNLGLKMMPGFIFQLGNETESYGSLSEEKISEIICDKIECEK